jgi:putative spermidine/putrescine transport system substrate-binding protein
MMLRALLAAGLLALAGPAPGMARDFTIALRTGSAAPVLREVYLAAFAATGAHVELAGHAAGLEALRAGAADWDVVQVTAATLLAACQAGVLDRLDWAALGGRERMLAPGATDCGLGAFARATVLSWDRNKFQGLPSWADFWDIAKVPGKRGLRRSPRGTLEIALLGDGVAPGDVYRTLRSDEGVERAFRRLDQLSPYIVWWLPGERDAIHLLGSGEVLMTSAASPAVVLANRAGRSFGVQWAGGLAEAEYWAILKGSANAAQAQQFLAFAADPRLQAKLPEAGGLGGLARGANDGLPAELLAVSPTANAAGLLFIDEAFWRDNGEKLGRRFDAWVAR